MNDWQPIETAPRDGSHVLLYTIHGDIEVGEWYQIRHPKYEEVEGGLYRRTDDLSYEGWNAQSRPTHWMPLPVPPPDPTSGQEKP